MTIDLSIPNNIKNFIDRECQPFFFDISQFPSLITEDVNSFKGSFITLFSKNRSDIAFIDRNISTPTSVLNGEISNIIYVNRLSGFSVKPNKDEILRVGYTNFHIITTAELNTIISGNDFSLVFGVNSYFINIFAVHDYSYANTTYRYFKRNKANVGFNFTGSFDEVSMDSFKDLRGDPTEIVLYNKPSRTLVYKCRLEKCLMKEINMVNNSPEPEKYICKCSECGKTHSITDIMKAYSLILFIDGFQGMFSSLVDGDYTEEEWTEANKIFNILESLNCCNSKCNDC